METIFEKCIIWFAITLNHQNTFHVLVTETSNKLYLGADRCQYEWRSRATKSFNKRFLKLPILYYLLLISFVVGIFWHGPNEPCFLVRLPLCNSLFLNVSVLLSILGYKRLWLSFCCEFHFVNALSWSSSLPTLMKSVAVGGGPDTLLETRVWGRLNPFFWGVCNLQKQYNACFNRAVYRGLWQQRWRSN